MFRKIIKIDEEKCNGCGLCAAACHEGAIGMAGGKAKLLREDYCDGLGDCLPACPTGAISFEEREAPAYDEAAVRAAKKAALPCGCPGTAEKALRRGESAQAGKTAAKQATLPCGCPGTAEKALRRGESAQATAGGWAQSELMQWPVQLKLVSPNAAFLKGAKLLVAADCTAYAFAAFHEKFLRGRIALIGCPKLDAGDYAEKLTAILRGNDIQSILVVRMEVPCCGGIADAVRRAIAASGKVLPWRVCTVTTEGELIED